MRGARGSEPCVFVVWETARHAERRIVEDLGARFVLADVVEVEWPAALFARNLTRLYGEALPPGSRKEQESGTGPFVVVAAVDARPRHGLRRTTRGLRVVNVRAAAAKRRYRRWTGGGFRVHGSLDRSEAERDLRLLLGVGAEDVLERRWDGAVRRIVAGSFEWERVADVLAAIASATPAAVVRDEGGVLVIRAEDVWWACTIAGGDPPAPDARAAELTVRIGGAERLLRLEAPTRAPGRA
jgi:hypothetical protein